MSDERKIKTCLKKEVNCKFVLCKEGYVVRFDTAGHLESAITKLQKIDKDLTYTVMYV